MAALATLAKRNMGWMIVLLAPAAFLYQLLKLGLFWRDKTKRSDRVFAMAIALLTVTLVAAAHQYHHVTARNMANELVAQIWFAP